MNSFLDPVGARSSNVYWRRRAILFAAFAVGVLLLAKACNSGGPPDLGATGEQAPVPLLSTYTPTPKPTVLDAGKAGMAGYQPGAQTRAGGGPGSAAGAGVAGATTGDSGAAGLAGLGSGVAGAGAEAAGAPAPAATVGGAAAKSPAPGAADRPRRGAGSATPRSTPTSDAEAAGPAPCAKKDLAVALRADQNLYSGKDKPRLFIGVRNTGNQPCLVNLGSKALTLTVVSGEDRIWSSDDCQGKGTEDIRLLKPRQTLWARSVWSMVRSEPGCPKGMVEARPGYYVLDGSANGVDAAKRIVFRIA